MVLFDFTRAGPLPPWTPIGDVVMGGVSNSAFAVSPEGCAIFSGSLSLEQSGGFASVRSPTLECDLSACTGITLRVSGDGKRYKINLRSDSFFDAVQYQAPLLPLREEWTEIRIPFTNFLPVFRGVVLPGAPPFQKSSLCSIGFLIAEKQVGEFRLRIGSIGAYR